jgi:Uma2 family endonuclease
MLKRFFAIGVVLAALSLLRSQSAEPQSASAVDGWGRPIDAPAKTGKAAPAPRHDLSGTWEPANGALDGLGIFGAKAMPEDGKRREIINGDMFVTPSPNLKHQRISQNLNFAILKYLQKNPIGEVFTSPLDVILSDFDVLEPDLLLVLKERREILKNWVEGAPDLAIEILSPSTAQRDRGLKLMAYARFGVREYWIVDPDPKTIEVYRLTSQGYELSRVFQNHEMLISALLPDFALLLEGVFEQA